ncbi:GxxExxY protein [Flavobacterium psychrophilum]|nr:GxxExxY protein [Flavobacterium psychrophilum]MCB5993385.1 GxxExxY protein [Flavobacterium psychrophilum]MCB6005716.1 GxxExxY protein [Flavobacterium psychrophilum]MCB6018096.1 GxxExxY protein [Flavobacterium psychrophilum]MCB6025598.1 GxxExxY protein [Flavobacterium psychrophilum]MCB6043156.1 GxxExxY protein [Flavobacterium psychrophilum]
MLAHQFYANFIVFDQIILEKKKKKKKKIRDEHIAQTLNYINTA